MSSLKEQRIQEKLKKQQRKAERKGILTPAEELNQLGIEYTEKGYYDEALDCFNQAIQLNSNFAEFYNHRGEICRLQKNYEQALNDFNQAIKINPNYAYAYNNRGNVYFEQKNYEQALNNFNKAIKINPNYAYAYNGRGHVYLKQKNNQEALNDFDQVIKINPNYAYAYNGRGNVYLEQKNYEQALNDFNQAIKINPNYVSAYNSRGLFYKEQGDYEQALKDCNQALKLNFVSAEIYNNCGEIYRLQKNYEQALNNYNQALQLDPDCIEAYHNRGITYFEQKKYEQALKDFEQTIKLYKKYSNHESDHELEILNLNLTIQAIYLQIKNFAKAREYVEKAFKSINFGETQSTNIYLKNIDNAEKLHNAQKRNENLLRSYTHMLGNTLFPENVLAVIENLKQKSPELRKEILQLYSVYQAETTIRQQGELLRIRYMTNNPDEFVLLIKNSCLLANSKESGTSIENVFNQALESVVSRFLNLNYGKLELSRNCLNLDWKTLKENFEQQIYFEHQNVIEWTRQNLINIDLIFETDKWQQVRFKPQEHAEALFFEYFNELLLNTFKYADFKQGLEIRFYMQPVENINYLYCEWQNICRENIISGSQIGLENLKEDLSQLNQSTTPETTIQIINENNLFKIILAFNKNLILFDPQERDQKREQNSDRWIEEEEEEDAHLVG